MALMLKVELQMRPDVTAPHYRMMIVPDNSNRVHVSTKPEDCRC